MLSDARESMNRVKTGAFIVRKGSYTSTTFNIVKNSKYTENLGKERENPKNLVDD